MENSHNLKEIDKKNYKIQKHFSISFFSYFFELERLEFSFSWVQSSMTWILSRKFLKVKIIERKKFQSSKGIFQKMGTAFLLIFSHLICHSNTLVLQSKITCNYLIWDFLHLYNILTNNTMTWYHFSGLLTFPVTSKSTFQFYGNNQVP